jgi:hypothetical protein
MRIFLLLFILSFFPGTIVRAEYRVFVLKITKPNPEKDQPPLERTVQSNLDPVQYRDLYYVEAEEQVQYIDTWRCPGRTGDFQDYCPKPPGPASQKAQIPDPNVSNQNGP